MSLATRLDALRPYWPWLKRVGITLFFGLLTWLLVSAVQRIDWHAVLNTGRQVPLQTLLLATGLSAASHLLYSSFDLLGRHQTGHTLRTPAVMGVTFVSYVFNLNLGSWVGAIALRYRLYSRLGLRYSVITRVLAVSIITNWLGYVLLAGLLFILWPLVLPAGWYIGRAGLRAVGVGMLLLGAAYLLACFFSKRRRFRVRAQRFTLPPPRMALLQAGMGLANWLLISSLLWLLMPKGVYWLQVASVLLLAAIAGVISHVPASLGVLEAVFFALMGGAVPQPQLLASLLLYRAFYYLLPLGLAALLYGVMEVRARRLQATR